MWLRCRSKIKGLAGARAQEAMGKEMDRLALLFESAMVSVLMKPKYFTEQIPLEDAVNPTMIPGFLPAQSRIAFLRASAGISAIARAAQSSIEKTGQLGFRPYDHMLMELWRYGECVYEAWGRYGRLAVARQKGVFPPKQQELLEKMAREGWTLFFSGTAGRAAPEAAP